MTGYIVVCILCILAVIITGMGLNNRDRYNSDTPAYILGAATPAIEEAEERFNRIKQYHEQDNSDAWRLVLQYRNAIQQIKEENDKRRHIQ